MQIYKVPKITGFTQDQLAQRIQNSLEHEQPFYGKVIMPLKSEQEITERMMRASDNDPRNTTPDLKGEVIRKEIEESEKQNLKARTQATEVIENRIQNQLRSMGIEPNSYQYSIEYEKLTEGGDLD